MWARTCFSLILCGVASAYSSAGTVSDAVPLADLTKANDPNHFSYHGATLENLATVNGVTTARVLLNQRSSNMGQRFQFGQNWSSYNAVSFVIQNHENRVARINFRVEANFNMDNAIQGFFYEIPPNSTRHCVFQMTTPDPMLWGIRALPPEFDGPMIRLFSWNRNFNLSQVSHWRFSNVDDLSARISVSQIQLLKVVPNMNGIVDRYGQSTLTGLGSRVTSDAELITQRNSENTELNLNPGKGEVQGSTTLPLYAPSTQWRVVKRSSGNFYFIHPGGRMFWSLGANTASWDRYTVVTGRENMFVDVPSGVSAHHGNLAGKTTYNFLGHNLERKFGPTWQVAWQEQMRRRMGSWGLNTLGMNSDVTLRDASTIPYTMTVKTDAFPRRLNTPFVKWRQLPDAYDSTFLNWCRTEFNARLGVHLGNPAYMGVFIDNEQSWGLPTSTNPRERYAIAYGAINAPMTQPAKSAFINVLKSKYRTIEALNVAWGTSYTAWTQVEAANNFSRTTLTADCEFDFRDFGRRFATTYYSKVARALRDIKNTGLYLGSRDAWAPQEVVDAAAGHVHVLSFNIYGPSRNIDWAWLQAQRKPVLISEFSFGAMDRGGFDPGPGKAYDQTERAAEMRAFLRTALKTKNVIGVHWFEMYDQPITGRWSDGENYALGLINVTDQPYNQLVQVLREETANMYTFRGQ
jgi:hypothetical protein